MKAVRHKPQSLESNILARIRHSGRGSVFVPGDFLDLGSRQGVDFALHRLVKQGVLRRLARGIVRLSEVASETGDAVPFRGRYREGAGGPGSVYASSHREPTPPIFCISLNKFPPKPSF